MHNDYINYHKNKIHESKNEESLNLPNFLEDAGDPNM